MKHKTEQLEVLLIISNFMPLEPKDSVSTLYDAHQIDKCLEEISWLESPNVIVAYGNDSKNVGEDLKRKWSKRFNRLQYLFIDECHSINDLLRQVEDRQLISKDFLFVCNCDTFCFTNLNKRIENFRLLRKQNKNIVATLLYSEMDPISTRNCLICYRTNNNKLVNHNIIEDIKGKRCLQAKKDFFLNETTFRTDLIFTNILICAIDFLGHFAGNYDFNSVDNIIQDILTNEEVIGQEIYLDIFERKEIKKENLNSLQVKTSNNKGSEFPGNDSNASDEEENDEHGKIVEAEGYKQEGSTYPQFIIEVRESMQELFDKKQNDLTTINESEFTNLNLEISSCKLAYNVPIDELPRLIFLSFIGLNCIDGQLNLFKKAFDQWLNFWNFYFKKLETRIGILHAIEDYSLLNNNFIRIIPNILHWLNQEKEFLEDEQIIFWFSNLNKESPLYKLNKLKELIEWLKEEDEEEEDEE